MIPSRARRSWAEIDADAIRHNVALVKSQVGPRVKVMGVVKANAYGHGVDLVAPVLAPHVDMFGVANVNEAEELRGSVEGTPIFILGPALPDERERVVQGGFIPTVSNVEEARAFNDLAAEKPVSIHVKLDTGMGRIGVLETEALTAIREMQSLPSVKIAGLASHLPVADEDDAYTRDQLARFHREVQELTALGLDHPIIHVENSAGILGYPAQAGDMVRAGLMLYGSAPLPEFQPRLRAVMTWKTRITLVRDVPTGHGISYGRTFITPKPLRIATLAVGYADGYQRHLSHRGAEVLIHGRRCPVLGRVTMDQILVDVTPLSGVAAGDEVVLLGRQGAEEIFAAELAQKAGTIAWEIFTSIGRRVERVRVN